MKKELGVMGVGTKIVVPVAVCIVITGLISYFTYPFFRIAEDYNILLIIGIVAAVIGFSFNLAAAFPMLTGFKKGKLVTTGMYRLCRNPMYVFQLFITLPGLMILFNSWLMLISTIIVGFLAFKILVKEEYEYLLRKFGEEYKSYCSSVLIKFL